MFKLLDANLAPPHAKDVLRGLLMCQGICGMTLEAFSADRDMQALEKLGLITWEAGSLIVTEKVYELAQIA
ncbi:MAG: hypothetical protein AAB973_00085 [Patescibacteria group bacterium]